MPEQLFDPIPTWHSLLNWLKDWVAVKAGLSDTEAQEVVIAAARKIGEFKADPAHGSFSAWLMRLTRWRIADQFWKRQGGLHPICRGRRDACPTFRRHQFHRPD